MFRVGERESEERGNRDKRGITGDKSGKKCKRRQTVTARGLLKNELNKKPRLLTVLLVEAEGSDHGAIVGCAASCRCL